MSHKGRYYPQQVEKWRSAGCLPPYFAPKYWGLSGKTFYDDRFQDELLFNALDFTLEDYPGSFTWNVTAEAPNDAWTISVRQFFDPTQLNCFLSAEIVGPPGSWIPPRIQIGSDTPWANNFANLFEWHHPPDDPGDFEFYVDAARPYSYHDIDAFPLLSSRTRYGRSWLKIKNPVGS